MQHCALCHGNDGLGEDPLSTVITQHGNTGKGDGRMARIIKTPPANLSLSVVPDSYLEQIIRRGGEPLGRSPKMPPWEDQLTTSEILSVVDYIKTFRPASAPCACQH